MSEPFLAEVKIVGFNFAMRGWADCDGQILPINQNQSLYSLLGTTYGGDGRTTFALPDLRGRSPIHVGASHFNGQRGGDERVVLSQSQIPSHTHSVNVSSANATASSPSTSLIFGRAAGSTYHADGGTTTQMEEGMVANAGSGSGHDNMQPFLVLRFLIALQGLFPSRN